jgi:hypothetical protein
MRDDTESDLKGTGWMNIYWFDMCFFVHFRIVLSDTPTDAQMIFII